ncbi:winged helix-turn-helix transcriptional regulator [Apilactobacillus xinyiensis]|uniref:Helix-turn-helix transcriptional regulator n=1 Tax=Apilactobacillus xinyiensis TaxID=2841032 RepID=A0ABT0I174_9LACO|nr:helix-turn-helix domain-containing protein [Apilactobacillus xinyiensis]MCK8624207.1 helix-turn-helix transcriptional regulator [Apilactobacillus xinyiensis]MCL0311799.1 helix-turn-helix transcriptional regulator [Apilactobacillus xinyiensis]MCL0318425.1 helix-turn-helix transcriptional regulator [Apilactobacillus xinyiensis]MCL0329485.1 helix-turn-helix transcriptional regulator [Apilactobacillus xinyiensis]
MTSEDCKVCPKFEQTFSILGKKWNGLIVESLLNNSPQRFKTLSQAVEKCSDRMLAERLKELESKSIVKRKAFDNSNLIEYSLTKKGEDLKPIMDEVHNWSDKWCHK